MTTAKTDLDLYSRLVEQFGTYGKSAFAICAGVIPIYWR
ncbi:hypothetical protein CEV32_3554 [Brucella rhizosphaerae]|uniref:Uncharacterized protein n=1 Tax=Brucella rhizosphaerae TaxID=571254 RepID=A0A256FTI6_9HYPH|nr:hypothetical protein CEV32_3554 [Brucella rhizosphaerae]